MSSQLELQRILLNLAVILPPFAPLLFQLHILPMLLRSRREQAVITSLKGANNWKDKGLPPIFSFVNLVVLKSPPITQGACWIFTAGNSFHRPNLPPAVSYTVIKLPSSSSWFFMSRVICCRDIENTVHLYTAGSPRDPYPSSGERWKLWKAATTFLAAFYSINIFRWKLWKAATTFQVAFYSINIFHMCVYYIFKIA